MNFQYHRLHSLYNTGWECLFCGVQYGGNERSFTQVTYNAWCCAALYVVIKNKPKNATKSKETKYFQSLCFICFKEGLLVSHWHRFSLHDLWAIVKFIYVLVNGRIFLTSIQFNYHWNLKFGFHSQSRYSYQGYMNRFFTFNILLTAI